MLRDNNKMKRFTFIHCFARKSKSVYVLHEVVVNFIIIITYMLFEYQNIV